MENKSGNNENKSTKRMNNPFDTAFQLIKRHLPTLLQFKILTKRSSFEALGHIRRYRHTDWGLLISAGLVGILIGFAVAIFHWAMEYGETFFHEIYHEAGTLIHWQLIVLPLIPALGGLGVGILQKTMFRNATIEGLDSLIHILVYKNGKMDWRNSLKSIFYAALQIGSGGGAGREGPTIVLGSSLGSTFAQILRLRPQQLRILCGSGAAAAISAIFNAPLGGIVFALEAIIGGTSIRAFAPLVISSVLSTATTRILVGNNPLIVSPEITNVNLPDYFLLALAGMLSGFVAIYYLKTFNKTSKWTVDTVKRFPEILRPAIGGLMAGILLMFLPTMLETTYSPINDVIAGNGLPLIQNSLLQNLSNLLSKDNIIFLLIFVSIATVILKPISNAFSLASSGVGGTMAPVLKVGAMFGFVLGSVLQLVYPGASPGLYALVCAGAVLAGTFQVPLAGGIILFEISRNYNLILPLVFSSVFASFIVQRSGVRTFNPFQKDFVVDENALYPVLKERKEIDNIED